MNPPAGHTAASRRGKWVVATILGVGGALAVGKLGQEIWISRYIERRAVELRRDVAAEDPARLRAEDHRALREMLLARGYFQDFAHYSDRAAPLLVEELVDDLRREPPSDGQPNEPPHSPPIRAAWYILLFRARSTRSEEFIRKTLPGIEAPDLRKEAEAYLKGMEIKRGK